MNYFLLQFDVILSDIKITVNSVSKISVAGRADEARDIGFDEGPVYEGSYQYLTDAGIEVVRLVQREAAAKVLRDYLNHGGAIYNG